MKLIFSAFLICMLSHSYAQTSSTEAKAAYLLAEEAFSANDWKGALSYLEECKSKIGKSNSKILYLQIMSERELAKSDSAYNTAVLNSIAAFEKAPDAEDFNEEKKLEVMKLKLQLKKAAEQKQQEALIKAQVSEGMKTFGNPGWPLGIALDTLKTRYPDFFIDPYHKKKTLQPTPGANGDAYVRPYFKDIQSFIIKNNRLVGYTEKLFAISDDENYSKGKAAFAELLEAYRQRFKLLPKPYIVDQPSTHGQYQVYTWTGGGKSVVLTFNYFMLVSGGPRTSVCSLAVSDTSSQSK